MPHVYAEPMNRCLAQILWALDLMYMHIHYKRMYIYTYTIAPLSENYKIYVYLHEGEAQLVIYKFVYSNCCYRCVYINIRSRAQVVHQDVNRRLSSAIVLAP